MIEYNCNKCTATFNIDKDDAIQAEADRRYIACPLCGTRNIEVKPNYKQLMEERKAVEI